MAPDVQKSYFNNDIFEVVLSCSWFCGLESQAEMSSIL